MSKPETLQSLTLPVPLGGLDFFNPLAQMPASNSPWLLNVDPNNQSLAVRRGYRIYATIATTVSSAIQALGVTYGTVSVKMFAYCKFGSATLFDTVQDVTTSTPSLAYTAGLNGLPSANTEPANINGRLAFINAQALATAPVSVFYNAGVWGDWTLRQDSVVSFAPTGLPVFYYKGRPYVIAPDKQNIAYGEVGQIQGILTYNFVNLTAPNWPVGQIFTDSQYIFWGGSFTVLYRQQSEQFLAIGGNLGDILIYAGNFPGSDDWELKCRVKISNPVSFHQIIQYQDDTLILTTTGIISLRDLYTNRDSTDQLLKAEVSQLVNDYWSRLMDAGLNTTYTTAPNEAVFSTFFNYPSGVYSERERRVYILSRGHIAKDGTYDINSSTMFVFNIDTKAWTLHKITQKSTGGGYNGTRMGPGGLTYYNGDIYFAVDNFIIKYDRTSYLDQDIVGGTPNLGYDFEVDGSYTNFKDSISTKVVQGYEPIAKQNTPAFGWGLKLSVDMGRVLTGLVNPANSSVYNKVMYSVGGEGTFFQYQLIGNTSNIIGISATGGSLEFYAINAFYTEGGVL